MEHTGAKEGRSLVFPPSVLHGLLANFHQYPSRTLQYPSQGLWIPQPSHPSFFSPSLVLQLNSYARTEIFKFSLKFGLHQLQHRPFQTLLNALSQPVAPPLALLTHPCCFHASVFTPLRYKCLSGSLLSQTLTDVFPIEHVWAAAILVLESRILPVLSPVSFCTHSPSV